MCNRGRMSEPTPTPPTPPPSATPASSDSKGLIGRVFDLSFSEFVTPSVIKFLFILGIIGAGLMSLFVFIAFVNQGGGAAAIGIIVAPLIFAFYVLLARVVSELYLLLFRIEENTRSGHQPS